MAHRLEALEGLFRLADTLRQTRHIHDELTFILESLRGLPDHNTWLEIVSRSN